MSHTKSNGMKDTQELHVHNEKSATKWNKYVKFMRKSKKYNNNNNNCYCFQKYEKNVTTMARSSFSHCYVIIKTCPTHFRRTNSRPFGEWNCKIGLIRLWVNWIVHLLCFSNHGKNIFSGLFFCSIPRQKRPKDHHRSNAPSCEKGRVKHHIWVQNSTTLNIPVTQTVSLIPFIHFRISSFTFSPTPYSYIISFHKPTHTHTNTNESRH